MTTMLQPANLGSGYTAEYDAWKRLVQLKDGATTVAMYAYDGGNRRVTKTTSSTRHYYYSDQWQVLEERTGTSTSPERLFVWGLRYADDLVLRDRDTNADGTLDERFYALHDFFSCTAVVDTGGTVQERYGYEAFVTSRVMDASFGSRASSNYDWEIRYDAYRWDSESGLYQVRNRYLHPNLGRWLTRDLIEYKGGINFYAYLGNNAQNKVDPQGLLGDSITAFFQSCAKLPTASARCDCYCAPVTTGAEDSQDCINNCEKCEKLATVGITGKIPTPDPDLLCSCLCSTENSIRKQSKQAPVDCDKVCKCVSFLSGLFGGKGKGSGGGKL